VLDYCGTVIGRGFHERFAPAMPRGNALPEVDPCPRGKLIRTLEHAATTARRRLQPIANFKLGVTRVVARQERSLPAKSAEAHRRSPRGGHHSRAVGIARRMKEVNGLAYL